MTCGYYGVAPSIRFDVPFEQFRGVGSFDVSYRIILIDKSLNQVIKDLSHLMSLKLHLRDCYKNSILVGSAKAFVVFKLIEHEWVYISEVTPQIIFSDSVLCKLSELGDCKVIRFENVDNDSTVNLSSFNSGVLAKKLEFVDSKIRGYEDIDDDEIDSLLDRLEQTREPVITDYYYRCINIDETVDAVKAVCDAAEVADGFLRENSVYAPCITWGIRIQASRELTIELKGLDEQKMQQLDYVEINS